MSLYSELMDQGAGPMYFQEALVKRFEPEEICSTIKTLLAEPQHQDLARALGDAGLAIYPASEEMLVVNAMMAMLRQDLDTVFEHMKPLLTVRGERTTAVSYRILVQALMKRLDYSSAYTVLSEALSRYPEDEAMQSMHIQLLEWAQRLDQQQRPQ
jgi:hypothetical protein